jgi:CheY-like chemotaxis protein
MQTDLESAPAENATPAPLHRSQKRVLVVEDARCMQKLLAVLLGEMHFSVDVADDGRKACQKAMQSIESNWPYDLILMDVMMPQMSGLEAVRWLRERQWTGPVVAVSAFASDDDHQKFLVAGYDGYVTKPLTREGLQEAVHEFMKQE